MIARAYLIFSLMLLHTLPVCSAPPDGSEYLDGGSNSKGLVLCHGRGKHPTWKVVEPLRIGVNKQLGYHTLSLQLPNEDKHWKKYADDFQEAFSRITAGIHFLAKEKGVNTIYLMGHSMGSRMASAYIAENPNHYVNGLIIAGCRNNGGYPFACDQNIENVTIPVLDIWGGGNNKDSLSAMDRSERVSEQYKQIEIIDANHKFEDYEDEFVAAVVSWLRSH